MKTKKFPSGMTLTTHELPQKDIDLLKASNVRLRSLGLPARPRERARLKQWKSIIGHVGRLIVPTFRINPHKQHGPRRGPATRNDRTFNNWSGADIFAPGGEEFVSISGRWTVPNAVMVRGGGRNYSSHWIGIDGDGSPDVFQAGTACDVNGATLDTYAWVEWFPDAEVRLTNFPVSPGDLMSCSLTVVSNTRGDILLSNLSRRTSTTFTIDAPSGTRLAGNCAEWIVERPAVNNQLTVLCDYGRVVFDGCAAFSSGAPELFGKVTLGEKSSQGPAIASLGGVAFLAWRGDGNTRLNVASSTDNGATFGAKLISGEKSSDAPSLCAHNGALFIAWKGDGNASLNVAQVALSGSKATAIVSKITLGEKSAAGPVLASVNGVLYLAWRGNGNTSLNIACSTDNGATFGQKLISPEKSSHAPRLAAHNGQLFIAWKGSSNPKLNVARVLTAPAGGATGLSKVTLGETSSVGPALASLNGELVLGWAGSGNDFLNLMVSTDNGATFSGKFTSPEKSSAGPDLALHNGSPLLAWRGDANTKLNVAHATI